MIKKKLKGTVLGLIAAATVMSGSTGVLAADPDGLTAGCWSGSFNINLKLNK